LSIELDCGSTIFKTPWVALIRHRHIELQGNLWMLISYVLEQFPSI
jgi:hypothetical protein